MTSPEFWLLLLCLSVGSWLSVLAYRRYQRRKRHHLIHVSLSAPAEAQLRTMAVGLGMSLSQCCSVVLELQATLQLKQSLSQMKRFSDGTGRDGKRDGRQQEMVKAFLNE